MIFIPAILSLRGIELHYSSSPLPPYEVRCFGELKFKYALIHTNLGPTINKNMVEDVSALLAQGLRKYDFVLTPTIKQNPVEQVRNIMYNLTKNNLIQNTSIFYIHINNTQWFHPKDNCASNVQFLQKYISILTSMVEEGYVGLYSTPEILNEITCNQADLFLTKYKLVSTESNANVQILENKDYCGRQKQLLEKK